MSPNRLLAEQHVERARRLDHPGGHRVDEHDLELDVRVLLRHLAHDPVPQRVAVAHRVGLGHQAQPAAPGLGEPEGMARRPLDDASRVDGDLDAEVVAGPRVGEATGADVLALGVLAHDHQVDAVGVAHLGRDAGEGPHRAEVDREVELLPQADDQAPDQLVVGDVRAADGAEQHGVEAPDDVGRVGGHRGPLAEVALAAPVELGGLQRRAAGAQRRLEHGERGCHDLRSDPVTRDRREAYCGTLRHVHPFNWSDQ